MFPNVVVILPEAKIPVPVICAWCCVILEAAIRPSGTVPLVNWLAFNAVRFVPIPL